MKEIQLWKVLSESDISPSKWFPLYRQTVRIHGGKIIDDYYISRLGDVAMVIPRMKNGLIAMVRQYKHGVGDITIEFPAGRIDRDEQPLDAATREVREETGIQCGDLISLGNMFPSPTKDSARLHGFFSPNCEVLYEVGFDENEDIETVFFSETEIEEMIRDGGINCSDTVGLWLKYKLMQSAVVPSVVVP